MSINSFLNQAISIKIIIIVGGFWLIVAAIVLFYFFGGIKEGFQAGLVGLGSALDYKMGDGVKRSWENANVAENAQSAILANAVGSITDVNGINTGVASVLADLEQNVGGPVPLQEGELLIFKENKFSPECCPSSYSNGDGCVCASPEQARYLSQRGGNRTMYDPY
jgi:hypothetical protein